jgi:hypothetical protein
MGKVARAAGIPWRYVQVKASYRQVHSAVRSLIRDELEYHIRQGCPAFDGIVINANAIRPTIVDEWDPDFLDAVVYERGTVPELNAADLEQARRFVLYDEGTPTSQSEPPKVVIWPTGGKPSPRVPKLLTGCCRSWTVP